MDKITLEQEGKILARLTTDAPMSSYDQPVWVVEEETPDYGEAVFIVHDDDEEIKIEILTIVRDWMVFTQSDGFIYGVIWSDGRFHIGPILDGDRNLQTELTNDGTQCVDGAVKISDDPSDLGALLPF